MTYCFAYVMLWVFYYIPKKNGLVVDLKIGSAEYKIDASNSRAMQKSLVEQEKNAKDLFRAMA